MYFLKKENYLYMSIKLPFDFYIILSIDLISLKYYILYNIKVEKIKIYTF